MAQQGLPDVDIPDPLDTADQYQQGIDKDLQANNLTAKGAGFGKVLSRALNGGMDARTEQATQEQGAVKTTLSNLDPQKPDEDDLSFQIRQAHAIYNTVAPMDTNLAMKAADRIATLSEAQVQQRKLKAETTKDEQDNAVKQTTQGTIVVAGPKGENFGTVKLFNDDGTKNADAGPQISKIQQDNPGSFPVTSEKFMSDRSAMDLQKLQMTQFLAMNRAQAKAAAGNVGDDVLAANVESYAVHGPSAWARMPIEERNATRQYAATYGINETDMAMASVQYAALKAQATGTARRAANFSILEQSMKGLVDQVNTAAAGLTRTDMVALNKAIIGGKKAFSNPAELRYATAVQGLVSDYARTMSNGVGMTSDTARDHAEALLPKEVSAAAMRAASDQMLKETGVLHDASDYALEALANPKKFDALLKIHEKLHPDEKLGGVTSDNPASVAAPAAATSSVGKIPANVSFTVSH